MTKNTFKPILVALLGFVVLCAGETAQAAPPTSSQTSAAPAKAVAFEVAGAVSHADAPRAEICLRLTRPVDIRDRSRIAAALELKKDGKRQKISGNDMSLTAQDLCVQNLQHRHRYEIGLRRIQSADGQKLAKAFTAELTIPDRKSVLTFVGDNRRLVLPRHVREVEAQPSDSEMIRVGMAHVLRSVNVMATHLTLYKVADRKLFAEAWQQFRQMYLSPSESLYFCRQKGQNVFESDLVFGEAPNEDQTLVAPLPAEKDLAPGLYYLAATPRGKEGSDPGLFAGQWFLVSDLRLSAVRVRDGIKLVAAQGSGALHTQADVAVAALDKEGRPLVEGKTGADGSVFLQLAPEQLDRVAVVTGQLADGQVDLFELGADRTVLPNAVALDAQVTLDQAVYRSGGTAVVTLRAENAKGEVQDVGESLVQIKTPEQKIYSRRALPAGKKGLFVASLDLPSSTVVRHWTVDWIKADGSVLASQPVVISPSGEEGSLALDLDRASVDLQSTTTVTLRALNDDKKPMPFENGILTVRTARPEIAAWKEYRFGDITAQSGSEVEKISFMTGADGIARVPVSLDLKAKGSGAGIEGLSFTAVLESGTASSPVILPVRAPGDVWVGIKSRYDARAFPENSVAQFNVIAVDMAGKRRALNDLYYLVYEEGRSFEWVPADGRWDYRQRPDHRRVGGGTLSVLASGENTIRWPVTAGHYVLEITNASGDVLSRFDFDAGRRDEPVLQQDEAKLRFVDLPAAFEMESPNKVRLFLAEPAMVTLLVTDGAIRQTVNRYMKAGFNDVEVTPKEGWGHRLVLRAVAQVARSFESFVAQTSRPLHVPANDMALKLSTPSPLLSGKATTLTFLVQKGKHPGPAFVSVIATPLPSQGSALSPLVIESVPVSADGKAEVHLALPAFDGTLRLSALVWNEAQKGSFIASLAAHPAFAIEGDVPDRLQIGDKVTTRLAVTNYTAQSRTFGYDIKVPEGLSLAGQPSGKLRLGKGERQFIPVSLTAQGPAQGDVTLVLTTSANGAPSAAQQSWPVYVPTAQVMARQESVDTVNPDQSYRHPAAAPEVKERLALVAPVPLKGVLEQLQTVLLSAPQTTEEIAQWIDVTQNWAAVLNSIGALNETQGAALRAFYVRTLLKRQNEDGSFAAMRAGDPGDLASSAAAVKALAGHHETAVGFGLQWLTTRLQNTWFDESERAARAFAFDTMAVLRKADISALRYFAETSAAKNPSPDVAAAIAHALMAAGDEAAAQLWIDKTKAAWDQAQDADPLILWRTLSLLSGNEKAAFEDIDGRLRKLDEVGAPLGYQSLTQRLQTLGRLSQKAGSWRVQTGAQETKHFGIWVYALPAKQAETAEAFKNLAARPLFVTQSWPDGDRKSSGKEEPKKVEAVTLSRHLYTSDGQHLDDGARLQRGKLYLMAIDAVYAKPQQAPVLVAGPLAKAYRFFMPVDGNAQPMKSLYPWMPHAFADLASVTDGGHTFGFLVDEEKAWSTLVLVRPEATGSFALPDLQVRAGDVLFTPSQNARRFTVE